MKLHLKKPLVFFDIESTGVDVAKDRIVEICVYKIDIDGKTEVKTSRVNPTIPIPIEASLIHGIYDEDIADMPAFKNIAKSLATYLDGCDLGGYNCIKFDIPLLVEEFLRAEIDFDMKNRKIVDVQNIFHMMEPRTLKAAYSFYCNKKLENAHSAEADTIATYEVFLGQLEKYEGKKIEDKNGKEVIPVINDIKHISEYFSHKQYADYAGRIVFNAQGEEVFNFGKHKGVRVIDVFLKDPSYYSWMMNGDFTLNTKNIIQEIRLRNAFGK